MGESVMFDPAKKAFFGQATKNFDRVFSPFLVDCPPQCDSATHLNREQLFQ
jgi:hypothetical protein